MARFCDQCGAKPAVCEPSESIQRDNPFLRPVGGKPSRICGDCRKTLSKEAAA